MPPSHLPDELLEAWSRLGPRAQAVLLLADRVCAEALAPNRRMPLPPVVHDGVEEEVIGGRHGSVAMVGMDAVFTQSGDEVIEDAGHAGA